MFILVTSQALSIVALYYVLYVYFALVISVTTVMMYLNCGQILLMLCLFMCSFVYGLRLHHAD
jgi:hypothetical protein